MKFFTATYNIFCMLLQTWSGKTKNAANNKNCMLKDSLSWWSEIIKIWKYPVIYQTLILLEVLKKCGKNQ